MTTDTTDTQVYPFPLRPDLMALLHLPRDLTREEADRLVEFVMTLAVEVAVENG